MPQNSKLSPGQLAWIDRLKNGDLSGNGVPEGSYLPLRNEEAVLEDVRSTEEYKDACCAAVGLGPVPDERYSHFENPADIALLRWCVRRGSPCMALPDTPRTSVRGFLHRLITIGGPVKSTIHRLSATDTAWIEQAVQEDVARGQLTRGNSNWGSPGFPTKESLAHKGIKRKRRMVVDYRGIIVLQSRKSS